MSKYELVGIAERLHELNELGVYAYDTFGKRIQMLPKTLVELFPETTFEERRHARLGKDVEYSTMFAGVEFFTLCTPEELEKAKSV